MQKIFGRLFNPLCILLVMICGSCATLSISDISSPDRNAFSPLKLEPAIEASDLRIDLVRHTTEVQVNDSTRESRDTPYHPVGFDLGNGMFYDLNGNLGFRIDELIGVTGMDCYSLEQTTRRRQSRADYIYEYCGNTFTITYPPGRRKHYQYNKITDGNTISVMYRNRLQYSVDFNDKTIVYRGRKRKWDTLHKMDENRYYHRMGWWREYFTLEDKKLYLERDYIIELIDNESQIRIIRPGFLINRTVLTIAKSGGNLYVYDHRYQGLKVEFTEKGLRVYRNRRFSEEWER